jgi:hypothetical protein
MSWQPTGDYQYGVDPYTGELVEASKRWYVFANYETGEYTWRPMKLIKYNGE